MYALASTDVHVWPLELAARAAEVSRFARLLSADECERAARFRFEEHRNAYVVARAALRILLGTYLAEGPETIVFAYGANGKPRLARGGSPYFNVSHSGTLAAFAFADCEIGIDVEAERPLEDAESIASRYFARDESRELMALPAAKRNAAFFAGWTRKEAFIKASGVGLSLPLANFRVSVRPGERARVIHVDRDTSEARRWTLHDLALPRGYAGAVAYRQPPRRLLVRDTLRVADLLPDPGVDRGSGCETANREPIL